MTEEEFIANVKNVKGKRNHRFKNSYMLRDYYHNFKRKHKGTKLTETQFTSILNGVFDAIFNVLTKGDDFRLPHRLGVLEIRKRAKKIAFRGNRIVSNLPIDWNETLKLWYSDKKSKDKKKLVRCDVDYIFKVNYNRQHALYNNKQFMRFRTSRNLKKALKYEIQNNNLDSYLNER